MGDGGVSERILMGVREAAGDDRELQNFLVELVYQEAENPHRWWKDTYRQMIERAARARSSEDED
jgi:hypothetical protein